MKMFATVTSQCHIFAINFSDDGFGIYDWLDGTGNKMSAGAPVGSVAITM